VFPTAGRFVKVAVTAYTSGTVFALPILRTAPVTAGLSATILVGGSSVVNAGVAGMIAVGGNIAVGTAPTANPIALCWDGTNTRRLLTDTSNGGLVLGSNALTNGQTLGDIIVASTTPAATQIKASAGRLTMLDLFNGSSAAAFFHLYNATAVTLGTTAAVMSFGVAAGAARSIVLPDGGLFFSTGIAGAWTNLASNTDNTALTAAGQTTNYSYI
jgi:hypothetical protein